MHLISTLPRALSDRRNLASSQDFAGRGPRRLAPDNLSSEWYLKPATMVIGGLERHVYASGDQIASLAALPFVRSAVVVIACRPVGLTDVGTAAWLPAARRPAARPPSDILHAVRARKTPRGSSPAIAQRRLTIRLIDCGVSAFSSTASQRSIARKIGPFLMSARSSHSRSASTGGPTRSTLPSSSASLVLVRPSWIARHGKVGEPASRGSSRAGGSFLGCSTLQPRHFAAPAPA